MAFGVKYRMDFTDKHGQDDYRIDVEIDGYGGAVNSIGHSMDGFQLNYNEQGWVQGFEGIFSFHAEDTDTPTYDADFFDRQYKQVKVKFYINTVLKNVGWLKPENTTREFIGPHVLYRVSFTDGLNDLREEEYSVHGTPSRQTLLQVIKNCLGVLGIDDLNLFLQCNLWEDTLMTDTASLFNTFKVPGEAFYEINDGEKVFDDCYTVLEKCIKPFYCRLAQVNGYWQITNGQEFVSQRDIYAYADLSAVSENQAYNREVNIDDFGVHASKFELSKAPPVHSLKLIHRNRNIGTNELSNGDFSAGAANWNNGAGGEAWTTFNVSGGVLIVSDNTGTGNPNTTKSFSADPFNIADIGEGNGFFTWRFKLTLADLVYTAGNYNENPPYLKVRITYPDATYIETNFIRILEGEHIYELPFAEKYPVDQLGNYTFTIYYVNPELGTLSSIQLNFDDIEVTQDATTGETNDQTTYYSSDAPGYLRAEEEIFFADGTQASDAGVLIDGSNNFSSSWSRYGVSGEGELLIAQFAKQYLNDRNGYFDKITIDGLVDYAEEIHFNSILVLNSKRYRFLEFSKNFKTKQISGTIQQVSNGIDVGTDVTIASNLKTLLTQMGKTLLSFVNIPGATIDKDGLVTTVAQTFSGVKEFLNGLKITKGDYNNPNTTTGLFEFLGQDPEASGDIGELYITKEDGERYQLTPSQEQAPSTAGGTITLDFEGGWDAFFRGSASFSTPKTLALTTNNTSRRFAFAFEITNVAAELTLPADFVMSDALWERTTANTWAPLDTGKFLMEGIKLNSLWYVKITGPYS